MGKFVSSQEEQTQQLRGAARAVAQCSSEWGERKFPSGLVVINTDLRPFGYATGLEAGSFYFFLTQVDHLDPAAIV